MHMLRTSNYALYVPCNAYLWNGIRVWEKNCVQIRDILRSTYLILFGISKIWKFLVYYFGKYRVTEFNSVILKLNATESLLFRSYYSVTIKIEK